MIRRFLIAAVFVAAPVLLYGSAATMRVDYYHSGNAKQEYFSIDRVVIEPLPWPGNPDKSVDDSALGNYLFEVHDKVSDRLLYSRGFSTIFTEWASTEEAARANRTFSESFRFPKPTAPVHIVLKERQEGAFHAVWSTDVDPAYKFVDTSKSASPGQLLEILKSGDPSKKVDLLVLGDGYTAGERSKFEKDARRFFETLFSTSPFREHRSDFNVWGLCPPALESGISRPSTGVHRRTPLGTTYDTFDSERYVLTTDNRTLRDVASFAPYEFIEILVNNDTYGGGGIFNLYATLAADSEWAPYLGVHEFGHHFAGLADEYYTSDVAYQSTEKRPEPWEPNVTALHDPAQLKWKDLVEAGTPVPTPWRKEEFEKYSHAIQSRRRQIRASGLPETEMNKLFHEEKEHEDAELASDKYASKVGAFEGANYEAKGYYRSQINCIMFTRETNFCRVCARAIERVIALYT
jgi:hypothetical protein